MIDLAANVVNIDQKTKERVKNNPKEELLHSFILILLVQKWQKVNWQNVVCLSIEGNVGGGKCLE